MKCIWGCLKQILQGIFKNTKQDMLVWKDIIIRFNDGRLTYSKISTNLLNCKDELCKQ